MPCEKPRGEPEHDEVQLQPRRLPCRPGVLPRLCVARSRRELDRCQPQLRRRRSESCSGHEPFPRTHGEPQTNARLNHRHRRYCFERVDGFVDTGEDALLTGEDLGHEHRLAQEALDLTGTVNRDTVLFGQFIETKNGDDVLKLLPACTKRKMLSMNNNTSWFCTSRKYSAMVTPARATRRRTPGGSSIWPNTKAAFDSTVAASSPAPILVSPISMKRSVPSRVRFAYTGEHRHTTVVRSHTGDHLLDEHGLAYTSTTEQADLAALLSNDGAGRWILPPFGDVDFALVDVERFTDYVPDVTQGDIAERHH
ncbi:hypothetical protein GQR58_030489 [Nymphon striatum]|nr:hypothetical protein GQR58_030489 [Nymphon striatum]